MTLPYEKYMSGEYLEKNPDWDQADSPWKAAQVARILADHPAERRRIAEVGCGAGKVLAELEPCLPQSLMVGFDISPDAKPFWHQYASDRLSFRCGDFLALNRERFDLILLLDVIEHLADPLDFLSRLREHANEFVFHIPLDLSALSVLREQPLLYVREKVGHIHYFTKSIALKLLEECGYHVVEWRYTGATFSAPGRGLSNRLMNIPRRAARLIGRDAGVRLLGGETLLVLARQAAST